MRSKIKKPLAIAGVLSALVAPATVALADQAATQAAPTETTQTTNQPTAQASAVQARKAAAKRRHVRRAVRLKHRVARMQGQRVRRGYAAALRTYPLPRIHGKIRTLRRELRVLRRYQVPAGLRGVLRAIAACESHGNPRAIGGGGAFRGKYQFDFGTWASVGGKGDPAAASEREQDYRAALLYRRAGSSPWPVCGR
jgi:Ni/Co efflux regulator RcnB